MLAKAIQCDGIRRADQRPGAETLLSLEELPERIASMESQQAEFHKQMADLEFFKQAPATIASTNEEHSSLTDQLTMAYTRWEQLVEMTGQQDGV